MKYLAKKIIVVLVAGGCFFTQANATPNFDSWSQVLDKVTTEGASTEEVKFGVNLLAKFFCDDKDFQVEINRTVESCNKNYLSLKNQCEEKIFKNTKKIYSKKEEVATVAKEYIACVGIR